MKYYFLIISLLLIACERTEIEESNNNSLHLVNNLNSLDVNSSILSISSSSRSYLRDLLFTTIRNTEWRNFESITNMSSEDIRNTIIVELQNRTIHDLSFYQNIDTENLCWWSLLYKFIEISKIRSTQQLKSMSLNDIRNTLIVENDKNLGNQSIVNLQKLPNKKLIQLGYSWFLYNKYYNLINPNDGKISKFDLDRSSYKFKLKSEVSLNNQITYQDIHVLKIVKTNESKTNSYKYLGVYHIDKGGDHLDLKLAGSNDLIKWKHITHIDHDAHQGDIVKWGEGYLIAYEEDKEGSDGDKTNGRNNLSIRYFNNYDDLVINNDSFRKSIDTSLHPHGVEGTPDIRNFSGSSPRNGKIEIGFHYYDGNIDRLAMGILTNGNSWLAWKEVIAEYNFREMNFKGNIGSRKGFNYNGTNLTLQEARLVKGDWCTWKVMLGLKSYYTEVLISTPDKSKSFANPSIIPIDSNKYAITLFMPTECNNIEENNGGVIYIK